MRHDDWNDDPSLEDDEDEDELFDDLEDEEEPFEDSEEEEEPRESERSDDDDSPMTILRGVAGLLLAVWLGWEGYQQGRLYGSVDRSRPEEFQVAYVHAEKDFWGSSVGLYGSLAGREERIRVELLREQSTAFFRGDTATVFRSPGCDCLVTLQQVEASGPFHRLGSSVWSWQGPAAVAAGLYGLLLLVMGVLGTLEALRGLSYRLRIIHEVAVGIFAVVAATVLGAGTWIGIGFTTSAGKLYDGVDPERTVALKPVRALAHHGWVRSEFSVQAQAADGRAFQIPLNKDEYLGLRVGDPLSAVLLDGGRQAELPRVVKGSQPIVRLFGRPFTWHVFIFPVGVLFVLGFVLLAGFQVRNVRDLLHLRRIWREEMERRHAGLDRVYWPSPPS